MSVRASVIRSLEMTLLIGTGASFLMILAKLPLVESRYFFFGMLSITSVCNRSFFVR